MLAVSFLFDVNITIYILQIYNKSVFLHHKSGYSAVGSAPRSGRGGRKFESSCPDILIIGAIAIFAVALSFF